MWRFDVGCAAVLWHSEFCESARQVICELKKTRAYEDWTCDLGESIAIQ